MADFHDVKLPQNEAPATSTQSLEFDENVCLNFFFFYNRFQRYSNKPENFTSRLRKGKYF